MPNVLDHILEEVIALRADVSVLRTELKARHAGDPEELMTAEQAARPSTTCEPMAKLDLNSLEIGFLFGLLVDWSKRDRGCGIGRDLWAKLNAAAEEAGAAGFYRNPFDQKRDDD